MATLRRSSRVAVGMRAGLASWVWEAPRDPRGTNKSTWPTARLGRRAPPDGGAGRTRRKYRHSTATDPMPSASNDCAGRPDPGRSIHRGVPRTYVRRRQSIEEQV
ncbi:hypothetical protein Airi01_015430 [Actinoallomurus iriomotensis]|uniref:Uncharacterized protein n=1 Tax=Actinoallomurus iriomotensis TaxID=478107 RepID=A0A9W6RC60_9ACTN|nr:hypothetical protein Airi01_015430 [Actinoallomurus iriomotensis]